ncbi:MAG: Ig-like domain-containing protein, partial [Prevotella sp.]|nr:Ig-like domain-containing protein [Prevotella sp.]
MPSGNVTVSAEFERAVVAVNSITLSQTEAAMTVGGETLTLTPTVLPAEATNKSVTWTSSDETVATVTDGGVTAVAAGTATITVTTTDGAKTATCT